MGQVVAVTRNGLGDIWLFNSFKEADQHPIVQYGDVICTSPDTIGTKYNRLDFPDLLRRLGDEGVRSEFLKSANGPVGLKETLVRYKQWIWDRMIQLGTIPPANSDEIVSIIKRDRVLSLSMKDRTMADETKAAAAAASKEPKAPKEPKEPAIKTIAGFPLTAKITLLVDANGTPYGPDNNPKRVGSATHTKFAQYKNGMTVGEAALAGLMAADIKYDVEKNFISIG